MTPGRTRNGLSARSSLPSGIVKPTTTTSRATVSHSQPNPKRNSTSASLSPYAPVKCGQCAKPVKSKGIQCDGCDKWYHPVCLGITEAFYDSLQRLKDSGAVSLSCKECRKQTTLLVPSPSSTTSKCEIGVQTDDAQIQVVPPRVTATGRIQPPPPPSPMLPGTTPRIVQGHNDPLSNFHRSPVVLNGVCFPNGRARVPL